MLKNSSDELEKEIVEIFNKVKNAKNDNDIIDALNIKKMFLIYQRENDTL